MSRVEKIACWALVAFMVGLTIFCLTPAYTSVLIWSAEWQANLVSNHMIALKATVCGISAIGALIGTIAIVKE